MITTRVSSALLAVLAGATGLAGCADDSDTLAATTVAAHGPQHRTQDSRSSDTMATPADGRPSGSPHGRGGGTVVSTSTGDADLSDDDVAGLLWMREEEQLAHDVYTLLGEEFGLRIFDNIASSERSHVEWVVDLLDRYGIDDPMADRRAGTSTIPEMQTAFDELVAEGRTSLVEALEVGALIEETDIVDLRARATDVAEIHAVFERLEDGSRRHLRAFVSRLAARDVNYEPAVLDVDAFEEIVSDR